jgi:cytochrome oxidase Cu insertion factor (SCO1/SenC/PrrC family)
MKNFDWKIGLLILLTGGGLIVLGYRVFASRPSDKFLPPRDSAPSFTFQDRSGRMFSSSELKGKVWAVDFIFAHCAGSCPMISSQMSRLQAEWRGNVDFRMVTFTVDPERDTAEVLKAYAQDYRAEDNQWFFLTGKKADIYNTIGNGFHLTAYPNPDAIPGYEFIHSTRILLVDANNMVRGMYDGEDDESVKKLHQDVKYLMSSRSHT